MNKRIHLFFFFALITGLTLNAQVKMPISEIGPQLRPQPLSPGAVLETPTPSGIGLQNRGIPAFIGTTWFDTQSNGSFGRRLAVSETGKVSAAWLFGADFDNGFPDRGSSFNERIDGTWGASPTERLEGALRTGYPDLALLGDDTDIVTAHYQDAASTWQMGIFRKDAGATEWTQTTVPTAIDFGMVWAKMAVGGTDNQTIHLIGITLSEAFGGQIYEGINQHLLYYRSNDGGETWEVQDQIIPGIDSSYYNIIDAESYTIDASGDQVAIGVFTQWGDIAVFTSVDGGDSWLRFQLHDFPLDKYDGNGYTADDIPLDPDAPSAIAMLTGDGTGSVLIDEDGLVHAWYPYMYVEANGPDRFFYPAVSGMAYWNQTFGADSTRLIADLEDFNMDGEINVLGIPSYFISLTSRPTTAVDADNNIYLAYSAFHEGFTNTAEDQNYRHIFIIKSEDGGETWSAPVDLISEENYAPLSTGSFECTFPALARSVDGAVHLTYQLDFVPGFHIIGDMDPANEYSIVYMEVDPETFLNVEDPNRVEELAEQLWAIYPNPTSGLLTLTLPEFAQRGATLEMIDGLGRRVRQQKLAPALQTTLSLENIPTGMYQIKVYTKEEYVAKSVLIQR
ncbi:MAG: T9SS type A sorting domain-containing protein [Bacteroidota bacterium]